MKYKMIKVKKIKYFMFFVFKDYNRKKTRYFVTFSQIVPLNRFKRSFLGNEFLV